MILFFIIIVIHIIVLALIYFVGSQSYICVYDANKQRYRIDKIIHVKYEKQSKDDYVINLSKYLHKYYELLQIDGKLALKISFFKYLRTLSEQFFITVTCCDLRGVFIAYKYPKNNRYITLKLNRVPKN